MEVVATGPFPTGSLVWRGRAGAIGLTVVAKATFALEPRTSPLAASQLPVWERDELAGIDPARWLWAPADLVPYKVRGDVVLVGHAHAPGGSPVRRLRVRLAAFGVDKTLEVFCDRRRTTDGRVLDGTPYTRMALGWDRAQEALQNPAGISMSLAPDLYGTTPIPNVVWPDVPLSRSVPAGLGPIATWWPGRREKLGQRGIAALPASWNGAAMPEDADDALFQVAPPDQQPARLDLDSVIYLENLHAAYPQLSTRLAQVTLRAVVERPGRGAEPLALTADTVWIDTDRAVCAVTWRGSVGLVSPAEAGTVRVWSSAADTAALAPSAPAKTRAPSAPAPKPAFDPRGTAAMDPAAVLGAVRALPFDLEGRAAEQPTHAAPIEQAARVAPIEQPAGRAATVELVVGAAALPSLTTPFSPPRWDPRETAAVDPEIARPRSSSMPFNPAPEGAPPPAFSTESRAPAPPRFDPRETSAVDPEVALSALAALPFGARATPPVEAAPPAHYTHSNDAAGAPPEDEAAIEDRPTSPGPAPFDVPAPAWIGPTAPAEGATAATAAVAEEVAPPAWLGPEPTPEAAPAPSAGPDPSAERKAELERRCLAREPLDGVDASGLSLAGIQLDGASLVGASFANADLSGATLRGANLTRANLSGANLSEADLSGATLVRADASGASLKSARLAKAKLQDAAMRRADLSGADLTEARLDGAALDESTLAKAKGKGSIWDRASLRSCTLTEADLTGASLAEAECAGADFGRSQLGKASLRSARCEGASFEGADASGARMAELWAPSAIFGQVKLEGAQLRGATLEKARFVGASLRRAVADGADLSGADLGRADLLRASLRDASLPGASLRNANLEAADLRGADLTRANLSGATLTNARLDGVQKEGVEGL